MGRQARRVIGAGKRPGGFNPDRIEKQKTKRATGGNIRCDQEWITEMGDDIVELETLPPDCFWDVKYQFQGYADEVNPDYFLSFRRQQRSHCVGTAYVRDERGGYILDLNNERLQRPCLNPAINGGTVCMRHGGQLPNTKEAAKRLLVDASEKAITTLVVLTGVWDETNERVEQAVRVKAANSVLDRAGVKAESTVEVQLPGYKTVMEKMFGEDAE